MSKLRENIEEIITGYSASTAVELVLEEFNTEMEDYKRALMLIRIDTQLFLEAETHAERKFIYNMHINLIDELLAQSL